MKDFKKVVRLGTLERRSLFCTVEWKAARWLSISGVHGPTSGGNAYGGCGQVIIEFKEYDSRGYRSLGDIKLAKGWTPETVKAFFDAWHEWHMKHPPEQVLIFLASLPDSDKTYPWA